MSDEAASVSDLKPPLVAAASTSSFSVTDILSPLDAVPNQAGNGNEQYLLHQRSRPPHHDLEASFMGPSSPSASDPTNPQSISGDATIRNGNGNNGTSVTNNNFSAYSSYSPRAVTPISSMASAASAAAAAAVTATTAAAYPHMHSMTQLNSPASTFSSGYCQPNSADLSHHYPDMRSSAAAASAASGWYSSPAADPRFASEYCKLHSFWNSSKF